MDGGREGRRDRGREGQGRERERERERDRHRTTGQLHQQAALKVKYSYHHTLT